MCLVVCACNPEKNVLNIITIAIHRKVYHSWNIGYLAWQHHYKVDSRDKNQNSLAQMSLGSSEKNNSKSYQTLEHINVASK